MYTFLRNSDSKYSVLIILILLSNVALSQNLFKGSILNFNTVIVDYSGRFFLLNSCSEIDSYLPSFMDSKLNLFATKSGVIKSYNSVFGLDYGSFINETEFVFLESDRLYKCGLNTKNKTLLGKYTYIIKKDSLFFLIDESNLNLQSIDLYANNKISSIGRFKLNLTDDKGEGNQKKIYFDGNNYIYSFAGVIYVYKLVKNELLLKRKLDTFYGIHTYFVSYNGEGFYFIKNNNISFYDFNNDSVFKCNKSIYEVKYNFTSNIKFFGTKNELINFEHFHTCFFSKSKNTVTIKLKNSEGYKIVIKD